MSKGILRAFRAAPAFPRGRKYFTASCIDRRFPSSILEKIAQGAFKNIRNPDQFSFKTVATSNKTEESSTQNLIGTIQEMVALHGRENFLLVVHNDCFGVESGIVKIREEGNYRDHLQCQVEEMLKDSRFFDMVQSDKLEFVPALYFHDSSGIDKVQTFNVKFTFIDELLVELESKAKFSVISNENSKTNSSSR